MVSSEDALARVAAVLSREAGMACPSTRRRELARAIEEASRGASAPRAAASAPFRGRRARGDPAGGPKKKEASHGR